MYSGQCGYRMGTEFRDLLCDEHGIDGDGKHCGNDNAQLCRINVLYHETLDCNSVPCAVPFDLEPGVIGVLRALSLGFCFSPGNLVNQHASARNNWAEARDTKAAHELY
jgi:tubulin beta